MVASRAILPAWHPQPAGGTLSNACVHFSLKMFSLLSGLEYPTGGKKRSKERSAERKALVLYQFVLLLLGGTLFRTAVVLLCACCSVLSKRCLIFLLINPQIHTFKCSDGWKSASAAVIFQGFFPSFSPCSPPPSVSCPSLLLLCTAKHHY